MSFLRRDFMKSRVLFIFFALVALAFQGSAQEPTGIAEDLSAVMIQTVFSGSLVDNEDGAYTLTLEVGDHLAIFVAGPCRRTGVYPTWAFFQTFSSADELYGNAVLELLDDDVPISIALIITAANYSRDDSVITYTATVAESEWSDEKSLEESFAAFDSASLFITVDAEFAAGFEASEQALLSDIRCKSASEGDSHWCDVSAWWTEYDWWCGETLEQ